MRISAAARAVRAAAPARWGTAALWLVLALAAGLLLAWALSPPDDARAGAEARASDARSRALIAFLPADRSAGGLLDQLARRGMAVGLMSATLGDAGAPQMALDVGQGARAPARAYDEPLGPLRLVSAPGRGGRIEGWAAAVERAREAPGDLVPGLLAETLGREARGVVYAGVRGLPQPESYAAADRSGRLARVLLSRRSRAAAVALAAWRDSSLVVARLPSGDAGLEGLGRLLAARRARDLVIAVRAPSLGDPQDLLAAGVAGPGYAGRMRSDTTRRDGLVAAPDLAPTVLRHLGLSVPDEMDGEVLTSTTEAGGADAPRSVRELEERLDVVAGRRGAVLLAFLAGTAILALALALARGRAGLRAGARIAFLAALWLPGLALAGAALRPGALAEALVLAIGSLVLGSATDRLVGWPAGPALPATVVFLGYAIDLAAGSALTALSVTGPNPQNGARFYGVGNELETLLSLSVLIGAGAGLTRAPSRVAAGGLALACLLAAVVIGAGRLGADVGGVITLSAGAAVAVVALLAAQGRGPSRRALIAAAATPVAALALLVVVDLLTGGDAHLSRSVLGADEPGELLDVVERRLRVSLGGIGGATAIAFALVLALLAAGFWRRESLLAPVRAPAFRAGLLGALAATVVGTLVNDAAARIALVGTALLALAIAYARAAPPGPARPETRTDLDAP